MELNLNKENATKEENLIVDVYNVLGELRSVDFVSWGKYKDVEKAFNQLEEYIMLHKWNVE